MPLTTKKKLLDALLSKDFNVTLPEDDDPEFGFLLRCPICQEYFSGPSGCKHLLAEFLDVRGEGTIRDCWVPQEPENPKETLNGHWEAADRFLFDAKKAKAKSDAFLLKEEWVPFRVYEWDGTQSSWMGWFAAPVKLFKKGSDPRAVIQELVHELGEPEEQDDEKGEETD